MTWKRLSQQQENLDGSTSHPTTQVCQRLLEANLARYVWPLMEKNTSPVAFPAISPQCLLSTTGEGAMVTQQEDIYPRTMTRILWGLYSFWCVFNIYLCVMKVTRGCPLVMFVIVGCFISLPSLYIDIIRSPAHCLSAIFELSKGPHLAPSLLGPLPG